MCTYGGKGGGAKAVTDVFWKEGCRVPEILASEVIALIDRGLMSSNHEATRNRIFEASLVVSGIPKCTGLDDVKKLLHSFVNEYYPERRGAASQGHPIYLHFYSKLRAKDAQLCLRNTAHQFGDVELVSHRKEIGTNQGLLGEDGLTEDEKPKRKRADRHEQDDDGFTVVKRV